MLKLVTRSLFLLSGLLTIGLMTGIAQAQSLRVSPLVIQSQTERGQARCLVEFTNMGKKAFRARIYAVPFTYGREGLERQKSSPTDLTPYLSFSPRELVLEPNQTRTVRLNARFLPSVPDGEYRVLMYADPLREIDPSNQTPTVSINTRLGITFYVLKGDLSPALQVESASYNPVKRQIKLLMSNGGLATVRPKVNWKLIQNSQEITKGSVDSTTIIAGGDRYLTIPYPPQGTKLESGKYQLSGQLDWSFPKTGTLEFNIPLSISEQDVKTLNLPQSTNK